MKKYIVIAALMLMTSSLLAQKKVDVKPLFNDKYCLGLDVLAERESCSDWKLKHYLMSYYDSPYNEDLKIFVNFTITNQGQVSQVNLVEEAFPFYDSVAVQLVKTIPDFIPAERKGKKVSYDYTVPVLFEVEAEYIEVEILEVEEPAEIEYFTIVEEMPLFNSGICAQAETKADRVECSTIEVKKYLANVPYPKLAYDNDIQGKVFIRFVIDEAGEVTEVSVAKPVDVLLDNAAMDYLKQMPKWSSGKQRGKAVKVQMIVPVDFTIDQQMSYEEFMKSEPNIEVPEVIAKAEEVEQSEVFTIVEDMPVFDYDNCKEAPLKRDRENCSMRQVLLYLEQVPYPQDLFDARIEGKVYLNFYVNEKGKVTNVEVLRSAHPSLDEIAVKHIQDMPDWEPGKQRGKAVTVRYVLPVTFRSF